MPALRPRARTDMLRPMIPRFGEPVRSDRTYTTRPGAYGVILEGRDLLITEQDEP